MDVPGTSVTVKSHQTSHNNSVKNKKEKFLRTKRWKKNICKAIYKAEKLAIFLHHCAIYFGL